MLFIQVKVYRDPVADGGSGLIADCRFPVEGNGTPMVWSSFDQPVVDHHSQVVLYGFKVEPNVRWMTLEEVRVNETSPW